MIDENVFEFDQQKRSAEIANQKAVKAAGEQFASLVQQLGCRWVHFSAYAPDGTSFQVFSHDTEDGSPGVNFFITPPKPNKR